MACKPLFDEETKAELKAIADDDNEIKERFIRNLSLVQPDSEVL